MRKKTLKKYNSIDHEAVFRCMNPVFGFNSNKSKIQYTVDINRSKRDFSPAPFFMFPNIDISVDKPILLLD